MEHNKNKNESSQSGKADGLKEIKLEVIFKIAIPTQDEDELGATVTNIQAIADKMQSELTELNGIGVNSEMALVCDKCGQDKAGDEQKLDQLVPTNNASIAGPQPKKSPSLIELCKSNPTFVKWMRKKRLTAEELLHLDSKNLTNEREKMLHKEIIQLAKGIRAEMREETKKKFIRA